MCQEPTNWEKCVEFHGHECPGLAIGYKVAEIALKEIDVRKAHDEELVAIVENDACGVDAIQVLTGCSFGKGNLIFNDYGKQVFTFGNRKTGDTVRISVKPNIMQSLPEQKELRIQNLLNLPNEEFCKIERVKLNLPKKARIFKSIICEECGEGASEPRIRVRNGKMICLACAAKE